MYGFTTTLTGASQIMLHLVDKPEVKAVADAAELRRVCESLGGSTAGHT
jgi:hypothetical protein